MTDNSALSGVISPILTPFDRSLQPDGKKYALHARNLLDDGCGGLVPFGTTGEANSLSVEERRGLLESLVGSGIDAAKLMPGTGLCSLPETIALSKHAVELGCGAVLMLPPFYYKGVSDDGIFDFFQRVIEGVGDDRLRVFLYHIPPQAVLGFTLELVGRLRDVFPQVIAGVKDSSNDWSNTSSLLEAFPDLSIFSGSEVFLLDNLRHNGPGCITASANVNARLIRQLVDSVQSPEADDLQAEITATRALIVQHPLIPMLKRIAASRYNDEDWCTVRPPLRKLDAHTAQDVVDKLGSSSDAPQGLGPTRSLTTHDH